VSEKIKKNLLFSLIMLVGILFTIYAFKGVDLNDMVTKISEANPWWLLLGMGVSIISHWLRAYRATLLYEAMHFKVGVKNSFLAVLIGYMMNYFIPRAGEVSRSAAVSKTDNIPLEKGLGSVVTERIVDMVLLLIILGIIFLVQFDLIYGFINQTLSTSATQENSGFPLKWVLLGVFATAAILLFLQRKKLVQTKLFARIFSVLQGFADGLLSIRHLKKPFLFVGLSVLIWVGYILMMYFCLFSMEPTSHLLFIDCLTVFAIGTIGIVLPAPGAGAGTFHFFVMQSLLLFGVSKEDGLAYATLVHGAQMILLIVLGLIASGLIFTQQKPLNEQG
jgi:uncharacterized protein (TIRG00374 family)